MIARGASLVLGLFAATLLLSGCGPSRRSEPIAGPIELSAAAAQGERVFMRHCHQCHPKGEAGLGPAINGKPLPGWLIRLQVRRGLGAMPEFPEDAISPGELDALIAYLDALDR